MKSNFFIAIIMMLSFTFTMKDCMAASKQYPQKSVTCVVTFPAGAGVDSIARVVAKYFPKYFNGQSLIVVNKPGAGGQTGWNSILREKKDGYTITVTVVPNIVFQPLLRGKRSSGYQTDDFEHIATLTVVPDALIVKNESQFKTIQDFIKFAQSSERPLTVGIPAVKSGPHVLLLALEQEAKVKFNIIPEAGSAPMIKNILGGHLDAMAANLAIGLQNPNIRPLAISAENRVPTAQNIPTFKECGYDIVEELTRTFSVAKGVPQEIVAILRDGFSRMAKDPDFVHDLKTIDVDLVYLDHVQTQKMIDGILENKDWLQEVF